MDTTDAYRLHEVGKAGIEYIGRYTETLKATATFVRLFLNGTRLDLGRAFALLADPVDQRVLGTYLSDRSVVSLGKSRLAAVRLIKQYLDINKDGLLFVASELNRSVIEPKRESDCVFFQDELYYYHLLSNAFYIYKRLWDTSTACAFWAFLAVYPPAYQWKPQTAISLQDLQAISRRVDHLLVSAYDDFGYLVWSRPGALLEEPCQCRNGF